MRRYQTQVDRTVKTIKSLERELERRAKLGQRATLAEIQQMLQSLAKGLSDNEISMWTQTLARFYCQALRIEAQIRINYLQAMEQEISLQEINND